MRAKRFITALGLVLACSSLCGCSSSSYDASSSGGTEAKMTYEAAADNAYDGEVSEAYAANDTSSTAMIRRSADVQLSTRDFDAATKALEELLEQYATVVLEQNEHNDSYRYSSRSLTARFRVDAKDFDALFKSIDDVKVWSVTSSQKYADDVTKQYSDTKQRIDALQVRYEWYKEQVQTTDNAELAREYSNAMFDTLDEITRLENQNAELDTDVKYSVVTISLYEDTTVTDIDESVGLWDEIVNEALVLPRNIAAAFGHLLLFLITALPTILVIACVVGVIVLIRKAWLRKHPSNRPSDRPRWRPFARRRKAANNAGPSQPTVGEPAAEDHESDTPTE